MTTPTPTDPYLGAKLTGCRQDTCSWEKVLTIQTVKRVPNGVLKLEVSYQGTMEVAELCRRDQLRNHRMFELGLDVMRFWVYEVRDDLDGCVERVKRWVDANTS